LPFFNVNHRCDTPLPSWFFVTAHLTFILVVTKTIWLLPALGFKFSLDLKRFGPPPHRSGSLSPHLSDELSPLPFPIFILTGRLPFPLLLIQRQFSCDSGFSFQSCPFPFPRLLSFGFFWENGLRTFFSPSTDLRLFLFLLGHKWFPFPFLYRRDFLPFATLLETSSFSLWSTVSPSLMATQKSNPCFSPPRNRSDCRRRFFSTQPPPVPLFRFPPPYGLPSGPFRECLFFFFPVKIFTNRFMNRRVVRLFRPFFLQVAFWAYGPPFWVRSTPPPLFLTCWTVVFEFVFGKSMLY